MMFEDRYAYARAERKAARELGRLDPVLTASERRVEYDAETGRFLIPVLGEKICVSYPDGAVEREGGRPLSGALAVITLHYLVYRGEPLRREGWLAYRDMPGAREFSRAFESMSEKRLAARFGRDPEGFATAAAAMDGTPAGLGDSSYEVPAFPRLRLLLVLWKAAEEGEGSAKILFPPSAPYYLHSEDLAALGVVTAERMISYA